MIKIKTKIKIKSLGLMVAAVALAALPALAADTTPAWPHPVPVRIEDGSNNDLMVMTLGDVKTPLTQGMLDPVKDAVTLNDGTVIPNYFKDVLRTKYKEPGLRFYQPLDKKIFPLPPSGWCTWYYYYAQVTEDEVKLNAKWIAENLKDYGAQYIQIDDGWQGTNRTTTVRDWTTISRNFPDGMDGLAKYIKSLGLTPGLWLAPHGQSRLQVVTNLPNVFLRRADGSLDTGNNRWEGTYLVDPSTPETQKYMVDLFTRLSKYGYEYFKIDGQPTVAAEYREKKAQLHVPVEDTDLAYRRTLESIRQAIGPNRYLLGCWGTPLEGMGIYNGSRTGGDIVLGWGGFHVALRATLQYYFLHNIAWYGDPDVMLVRSPMTLDQARVWAALQGLTGQALMATDRMVDLSSERVELVRSVYPPADIRPLDVFRPGRNKRIWDLKVNHLGRNYDVVGVFNFNEGRSEQTLLSFKDLGLAADQPVHVFDVWNKEYLGSWKAGIALDAAPTSCRLVVLVPADGKIQLVSTSRHLTQGWVDLTSLSRDDSGLKHQGASKVVKNDPYELRFAFPQGTNYAVKSATARGRSGKLPVQIFNHQGWAAVSLTSPKTEEVTWEVEFGPATLYHYPIAAPTTLAVDRVGLDGANVRWAEQYYLNTGYLVYLNGALRGYTPRAGFPLRGLDPRANNTVTVRTVWEDGRQSPNAQNGSDVLRFSLEKMVPAELALADLEPLRSNAGWRGYEVEDSLAGNAVLLGGKPFGHGLVAVPDSEIEYDLQGLYREFTAQVGVDDTSRGDSSMVFSITGDGKELWRSDALKKADGAKAAKADVTGVKRLMLKVSPATGGGGRRGGRDQADWAEARVTRGGD